MTHPEQIELDIHGLLLRAQAWGPPDGKPVLALHGWLDNSASFVPLVPWLDGYRVVALDLPGHGHSDHRPPGAQYHFVDYVANTIGAADALGWDTFHLVGHSMGAGICSLVAGTVPDRVSSATFIEGLGPLSNKAEKAPTMARLAIERLDEFASKEPRVYTNPDEARERMRTSRNGLSEAATALLFARGSVKRAGGVAFAHDPRLRAPSIVRFTEPQVLAFLGAITSPVLMFRARQGWPFKPGLMGVRKDTLEHMTYLEIDGHHHVHMDWPESVGIPLREHLGS